MINVESQHQCIVNLYAGGKIHPIPSIIHYTTIDGTRKCGSDFGRWINLFPLQRINEFLVFYDQIGPISKNFVRALMARLKASQLDADAVESNTIAVAR
jgi:hypothetical protein